MTTSARAPASCSQHHVTSATYGMFLVALFHHRLKTHLVDRQSPVDPGFRTEGSSVNCRYVLQSHYVPSLPIPFLPFSALFHPLSPPPLFSAFFPSTLSHLPAHLSGGPPQSSYVVWGSAVSSPSEYDKSQADKPFLVYSELKITVP